VAEKNTRQKRTNTQINKRRHPKKIVPNCSSAYICVFVICLTKTQP
jgi:hypothetical protein